MGWQDWQMFHPTVLIFIILLAGQFFWISLWFSGKFFWISFQFSGNFKKKIPVSNTPFLNFCSQQWRIGSWSQGVSILWLLIHLFEFLFRLAGQFFWTSFPCNRTRLTNDSSNCSNFFFVYQVKFDKNFLFFICLNFYSV